MVDAVVVGGGVVVVLSTLTQSKQSGRRFQATTGYQAAWLEGRSYWSLVHPADVQRLRGAVTRCERKYFFDTKLEVGDMNMTGGREHRLDKSFKIKGNGKGNERLKCNKTKLFQCKTWGKLRLQHTVCFVVEAEPPCL